MSITVRASNGVIEYFTATSSTNQTVDLSDAAVGDVRILVCNYSPDGTGTVPSHPSITGWEQIGVSTPTGAASDSRLSIYRRDVESGDTLTGATQAISLSNTATVGSVCFTLEGVDLNQIIDVTAPSFITGTGSRNCPSITTVTDDAFVCHACVQDATSGAIVDGNIPVGDTLLGTMNNNPPSNGMNLGVSYNIQATAGASGTATWQQSSSEEWVGATFAIKPITEGITDITPSEFTMHQANLQITISGAAFGATQGTGTVYISTADTIAGSPYLVDVGRGITSWSDTEIIVNLVFLTEAEILGLQRVGPGSDKYTIVSTDGAAAEYSNLVTIHRPPAFTMVPSSLFSPGSTTAQLAAPGIKTTGDFGGGRIEETDNPSVTTTDPLADEYREDEWCFAPTMYVRKVTYEFRVVYDGQGPGTISQIPYMDVTGNTNIKIRVVPFSLRTTTGTQDITLTDLGPASAIKGAMFFASGAEVLDTSDTVARNSIGFTDKTDEIVVNRWIQDGSVAASTRRNHINGRVIRINDKTSQSTWADASVNSWITDGVRLDVNQIASADAIKGHVIFFVDTGSDLSIKLVSPQMNLLLDVDVTNVLLESEALIAVSYGGIFFSTATTDRRFTFGAALNTGAVDLEAQYALALDSNNAANPIEAASYFSSNDVGVRIANSASLHHKVQVLDFDANGFTLSPNTGEAATTYYDFFCISTNRKLPIGLISLTGPTSAAVDWTVTSSSVSPQAVVGVQSAVSTLDTLGTTGEVSVCFYAFDEDGNQHSIGLGEEDGVTPSNTHSQASSANSIWVRQDGDAGDLYLLGAPDFIPGGFEYPAAEITTVDATPRYGWAFIFGKGLPLLAQTRSADITGIGTVVVSRTKEQLRTSSITATSICSSASVREVPRTVSVTSIATVVTARERSIPRTISISGVASVDLVYEVSGGADRAVSITSTGQVSVSQFAEKPRTASIASTSSVDVLYTKSGTTFRTVTATAVGQVTTDRGIERFRTSSSTSTAAVTAIGRVEKPRAITVIGTASVSVSRFINPLRTSESTGAVFVTSDRIIDRPRISNVDGVATVSSTQFVERIRTSSITGTCEVTAVVEAAGVSSRISSIAATGQVVTASFADKPRTASVTSVGTVLAVGVLEKGRIASVTATASLSTSRFLERLRTADLIGVGDVTVVSQAAGILSRTSSISGTSGVNVSKFIEHPYTSSITCVGGVSSSRGIERNRSSSVIAVSESFVGRTIERLRTASISAFGSVLPTEEVAGQISRTSSVSASSVVTAFKRLEAPRQASSSSVGSVGTGGYSERPRVSSISSFGVTSISQFLTVNRAPSILAEGNVISLRGIQRLRTAAVVNGSSVDISFVSGPIGLLSGTELAIKIDPAITRFRLEVPSSVSLILDYDKQ